MAGCCDPSGYRQVFNSKEARRAVRSYRRKGLGGTARPMVDALVARRVDGATLVEVGAGVGASVVELMRAGVASSVAYDLSPSYETAGRSLLDEHGLSERVQWRVGDFATDPAAPEADVLFLNRVVCCYPDMPLLVDAAAARSRRLLAMAYPRQRWLVRVAIGALNLFLRVVRTTFRVFVHSTADIGDRVDAAGFEEVASGRSILWEWHVWERPAA